MQIIILYDIFLKANTIVNTNDKENIKKVFPIKIQKVKLIESIIWRKNTNNYSFELSNGIWFAFPYTFSGSKFKKVIKKGNQFKPNFHIY